MTCLVIGRHPLGVFVCFADNGLVNLILNVAVWNGLCFRSPYSRHCTWSYQPSSDDIKSGVKTSLATQATAFNNHYHIRLVQATIQIYTITVHLPITMKTTAVLISLTALAPLLATAAPTDTPHLAPRDEDCQKCQLDGHKLWDLAHAEPSAPGTCNIVFYSIQKCYFWGTCGSPNMVWGFMGTNGDNLISGATQQNHGFLGWQYTAHAWDNYGGNLYLGIYQQDQEFSGFSAQYEHNGGRDEYNAQSANCIRRDLGNNAYSFQCTIKC